MKPIKFVVLLAIVLVAAYYWNNPATLPPFLQKLMPAAEKETAQPVKEFAMESSYVIVNDVPRAFFSVKDIAVKIGDLVRIKVLNTNGTHDFNIDEYGISEETPQGAETIIEFTADKTGEFKYYCSKYNHRSLGQEGTLRVE